MFGGLQSSFLLFSTLGSCLPAPILSGLSSSWLGQGKDVLEFLCCLFSTGYMHSTATSSSYHREAIASGPHHANGAPPTLHLLSAHPQRIKPVGVRFSLSPEPIWMFLSPPYTDCTLRGINRGYRHQTSFPQSFLFSSPLPKLKLALSFPFLAGRYHPCVISYTCAR